MQQLLPLMTFVSAAAGAAGLRAFAEDYFRGSEQGASGGSWGPRGLTFSRGGPLAHLATIIELRGPLPLDPAIPAAAAAAATAFVDDEDADKAAVAAIAAAVSSGHRWTDAHQFPRALTQETLVLLLQKKQQQQEQRQQQQQPPLGVPDYGSLSFMTADFGASQPFLQLLLLQKLLLPSAAVTSFAAVAATAADGADGQVVNEDITNVLLVETRAESIPATLRSVRALLLLLLLLPLACCRCLRLFLLLFTHLPCSPFTAAAALSAALGVVCCFCCCCCLSCSFGSRCPDR